MKLHPMFQKVVEINDFENEKSWIDGKCYLVKDLIECDGIYFQMDLKSISLHGWHWDMQTTLDFIGHVADLMQADLCHPIILHPSGAIINGWHRVCKAILTGKSSIKAKRLIEMPQPIGEK